MGNRMIDGVDYGPLACLIGVWRGNAGLDIAPEPDGDEHNPYYETIVFDAAGDVANAERQTLAAVRYHQSVSRKSDEKVFHDQVGYWLWDQSSSLVMQTLTIPRAVSLLAGGAATKRDGKTVFEVRAASGDAEWGIIQSPFMQERARTTAYRLRLKVAGDRMSYRQTSLLDIYGRHGYEHTDENRLRRVS